MEDSSHRSPGHGTTPTSPPVPAATVILLRDSADGPEVLLLERHAKAGVLPDMYVFPGGRVEPADLGWNRVLEDLTRRPEPSRESQRFGEPELDHESCLGLQIAALRETFEESGILLARSKRDGRYVGSEFLRSVREERLRMQAGELRFQDFVRQHELELELTALTVHARWITPEVVKHRFDTLFFAAVVPDDQEALHDGVEATSHVWVRPERALEEANAGRRRVVFPTACNLETLFGFASAQSAWEASRTRPIVTVLPRVEQREGRRMFVIPPEAGYPTSERPAP